MPLRLVLALTVLALAPAPLRAQARLAAGPMPTYAEMTSAGVWVQLAAPGTVQLRAWPDGDPAAARLTAPLAVGADDDHLAHVVLDALRPGTPYAYEVYVDGARVAHEGPFLLATQPLWRFRGDPPELTILIGSCAYVNDAWADRPGREYGGGFGIFDVMAEQRADLMLWMGDNVYYREPDWLTEPAMRARYAHTRALPELQRLLASTHHYAIWDDHDYGPNDSDRAFRLRREAREVFMDYWPDVTWPEQGVARRFGWADVDVFLLDDRSFRSPNAQRALDDKVMLGDAQRRWLVDALAGSSATFKLVVCGGQVVNPIVRYEGFGEFPVEQRVLFDALVAERIEGLVFLSGDRHHSELLAVTWEGGGYPWYEFTSSPLTAGAHEGHPDEIDNPARVPGTFVRGTRSFGKLAVRGPAGARRLELSAHDASGAPLWQHVVEQAELRFGDDAGGR